MVNSKNLFWLLLNAVLAILIVLGMMSFGAFSKYQNSLYPVSTINVGAEGKVTAIPDIAKLSFSVVSEGKDPAKIAEENTEKMNAAVDFVKEQGINKEDIQTSGYNLHPRYEYDEDKRTSFISGYRLTQTVNVKIRDFSKINEIVGALPAKGINQIGSLSFEIDEPEEFLSKARAEAFEKAFAKAKEMAKQNGVKIKRVVTFSDSRNVPSPIYMERSLGMGAAQSDMAIAPKIEPGSQEVTVNVSVTYEIR